MRRRTSTIALTACAALALAACGGGSGGEGTGGGGEGEGGGPRAITVAETNGMPSLFLTYGVQEGYFEEQGLDVEVSTQMGGSAAVPALMSGEIEAAGSNVVSLLLAGSQGLPLSIVAAGTSAAQDSEEDFSGLVVPADSDIAGPQDLSGARIGVNTLENINEVVIGNVLEAEGLSLEDVELVELPFPDMQPALERGDVDAAVLIEPFLTTAVSDGMTAVARPYTALRPGLQIGAYVMTQETTETDPELVSDFQAGVQATADAIAEDPQAFRDALPELGDFDPQIAADLSLPVWHGTNDEESLALINESLVTYGILDSEVDLSTLLYEE
ncbi:ABC transporter substrate-binding protein [Georgenia alba]|uniref:ABC transporter substrate-binding protein n=1 Tax=Georgenia alba TaxID=2233858 RepID=A0ABW2QD81_9MICO